jgi:hypothetical protein
VPHRSIYTHFRVSAMVLNLHTMPAQQLSLACQCGQIIGTSPPRLRSLPTVACSDWRGYGRNSTSVRIPKSPFMAGKRRRLLGREGGGHRCIT